MLRWLDQSQRLSKLLLWFSNALARQRGLPALIGIGLILIGFVIQLFDVYSASRLVEVLAVVTHNLGVLIAFVGLLLATPLGR
jgi:hypothetical protein